MKHLQSFDEFLNEASNFKQTLDVLKRNDPNNDAMYAAIEVYLNAKPNKILYEVDGPLFDKWEKSFNGSVTRVFNDMKLSYDEKLNVAVIFNDDKKTYTTYFYTK